MELKLKTPTLPEVIEFNFEELKREITEKTAVYVGMVYEEGQIKDAKSDAATLRKFAKALSDERIRVKKELLKPYEDFEAKVKELTDITDKAVSNIDGQIKAFEQKKKDEKKGQIVELFESFKFPSYITLEKIWDEKWLNSSCSLSRIKEDLKTIEYRDNQAMESIKTLPEYAFEAAEYYKQNLDIAAALAKANELTRMARAKKEAEKEIPFTDPVPETEEETLIKREWIKFEAYLSAEEARELGLFFKINEIKFKPIK